MKWWTWSGSNRRPSRQAGTRSGVFFSYKLFDRAMRLPVLYLPFAASCIRQCVKFFLINQNPRSSASGRHSLSALVFCQSGDDVLCTSNIKPAGALALQYVNKKHIVSFQNENE